MSQMVWQGELIADWATEFQTGWRVLFSWLLQRLQALIAPDRKQLSQQLNTDSILNILEIVQSEHLSKSLFDTQV